MVRINLLQKVIMIIEYLDKSPEMGRGVFIADDAKVIGDVRLGHNSSIFFGCVVRGDINYIEIGDNSNIQDLSVLHVADDYPCIIGKSVVGGHNIVVHACTVEDDVLLGIGCKVLDGAVIGEGSIVGAGSVVVPKMIIPPNSLVLGIPGKVIRKVSLEEREYTKHLAQKYIRVKNNYLK